MLKELHLKSVGPSSQFDVEFADRVNIFTGDNGLGKSFLLDVAWWVLTGNWVEQPAYPRKDTNQSSTIMSKIDTRRHNSRDYRYYFDFSKQKWSNLQMSPLLKEVVIFVRVDGSFSVFDQARKRNIGYNFTPDTLWNGLKSEEKVICNGLIQDWVTWQNQPQKTPFQLLSDVIKQLSPHPDEWIEIGEPTRVSVDDVRDIPTINLPYGNIPITQASAGMKRILGLAYLLVWTWYEHEKASELRKQEPMNQIILLIDEIESHLHPRWQRVILPSILSVVNQLKPNITIQALVTTHSPLVLASLEPIFDEDNDKLFLFEMQGKDVELNEVFWTKQGDTVGWLTSEIFGLKQARSQESETAIEAAEAWMRNDDMNAFPEHLRTQPQIHQELQRLLPGHDPFWPRWIVTAERINSGL